MSAVSATTPQPTSHKVRHRSRSKSPMREKRSRSRSPAAPTAQPLPDTISSPTASPIQAAQSLMCLSLPLGFHWPEYLCHDPVENTVRTWTRITVRDCVSLHRKIAGKHDLILVEGERKD